MREALEARFGGNAVVTSNWDLRGKVFSSVIPANATGSKVSSSSASSVYVPGRWCLKARGERWPLSSAAVLAHGLNWHFEELD